MSESSEKKSGAAKWIVLGGLGLLGAAAGYKIYKGAKETTKPFREAAKAVTETTARVVGAPLWAAKKTGEGVRWASKKTSEGAKWAAKRTKEGTKWASKKAKGSAKWAVKKTKGSARWASKKAREGGKWLARRTRSFFHLRGIGYDEYGSPIYEDDFGNIYIDESDGRLGQVIYDEGIGAFRIVPRTEIMLLDSAYVHGFDEDRGENAEYY